MGTATVKMTTRCARWLTDPDLGDPDDNYIVFDDQGAPIFFTAQLIPQRRRAWTDASIE